MLFELSVSTNRGGAKKGILLRQKGIKRAVWSAGEQPHSFSRRENVEKI